MLSGSYEVNSSLNWIKNDEWFVSRLAILRMETAGIETIRAANIKKKGRGCCKTKVEQQPRFLWKSGSVQYFGEQIVKKFVTKRKKWYSKAGLLG